ncbi:MAG: hypothetical protein AB7G12_09600 [Thermoanaerobaculia bacterium]
MKMVKTIVFGGFLLSASLPASTLTEQDVVRMKSDIESIYEAFEAGDAKPLVALTHESLLELVGGKEMFEKITQEAIDQLRTSGVKFIESKLGTPDRTYDAGDEEVCFVPRISTMEIEGTRAKSIGFMVAIRQRGTSAWKYLDGAGLRKHPDFLYTLLPELERGIEFPPNRIEVP